MPATVGGALRAGTGRLAAASRNPRRDAELLLMHVLGCDLAALLAHPDRPLSPSEADRYEASIERRAASEPIQHITGEQEFFGLSLKVTPDVLIPRPETEFLVESALALARGDRAASLSTGSLRILDVGTGSGAIAIALASHLPDAMITAVDLSAAALNVARENARRHGVRIRFLESDLLDALAGEPFDILAANLPYVSVMDTLEAEVAEYEPRQALFAGLTGLELYQRLLPQAHRALAPGGWLLVEIGYGQRAAMESMLSGWQQLSFVEDLQQIPRIAIAQRAG